MNIQAMTCLLVAAVLASLTSGGTADWRAPPAGGDGDVTAADGYYDRQQQQPPRRSYYYHGVVPAGRLVSAQGAAITDDQLPIEQLVLRLLRANAERLAAFRRDSRQPNFTPRKPTCQGNSCNQRGWKRTWERRR